MALLKTFIPDVSTHSRPKAAGTTRRGRRYSMTVSTHSRPKAAGKAVCIDGFCITGFNTQPPEGGWRFTTKTAKLPVWFQHTAARRRLE